jgi:hypothetical protein
VICILYTGFVPVATSEFPGGSFGRCGCAGRSRQHQEENEETVYLHPVAGGQTCSSCYTEFVGGGKTLVKSTDFWVVMVCNL